MKTWPVIPMLALFLGCPGSSSKQEVQPMSYEIQLHTTPYDLRPGGATKAMYLNLVQQPGAITVDFRNWPTGTWKWELLNVPSGVDGGTLQLPATGHFSDLIIPPDFPVAATTLFQNYQPPTALPTGVTRMEMRLRITITPPESLNGGPVVQAETPVVVDANAPALSPSSEGSQ